MADNLIKEFAIILESTTSRNHTLLQLQAEQNLTSWTNILKCMGGGLGTFPLEFLPIWQPLHQLSPTPNQTKTIRFPWQDSPAKTTCTIKSSYNSWHSPSHGWQYGPWVPDTKGQRYQVQKCSLPIQIYHSQGKNHLPTVLYPNTWLSPHGYIHGPNQNPRNSRQGYSTLSLQHGLLLTFPPHQSVQLCRMALTM